MIYGIVYKATNILNGKSYIGQTTRSLDVRKKAHINDALSGRSTTHFHKALKKYGEEFFKWEVLHTVASEKELNTFEIMSVIEYDTLNSGYNMTEGGEGTSGSKRSLKSRQLMSRLNSGAGNPNYGKHHSAECKNKISEANKNRLVGSNHPNAKRYLIITPDGKEEIAHGLRKYCREHGLDHSNLVNIANGIGKSYKGYKCSYI